MVRMALDGVTPALPAAAALLARGEGGGFRPRVFFLGLRVVASLPSGEATAESVGAGPCLPLPETLSSRSQVPGGEYEVGLGGGDI